MSNKPTKKDKKRVDEFLGFIENFFQLKNYDSGTVYKKEDESNIAASIKIEEDYQRITLFLYPYFWKLSLDEQRSTLLHEGVHYLIQPIADIAQTLLNGQLKTSEDKRIAWERSVSSTTNIFDFLLRGERKWPFKEYQEYSKVNKIVKKKRK